MVLLPLNGSLEAGIAIQLVLTVSEELASHLQSDDVAFAEGPRVNPLTNAVPLKHETSSLARPVASGRNSIFHPTTEAGVATGSESFVQAHLCLADHVDPPPENEVSFTTVTAGGLASATLNLDGIINTVNLLPDVSQRCRLCLFI